MGRIKTSYVKNLAKEFMESYPGRFTADFEENKEVINETSMRSKWLRNRVAGYITTVKKGAAKKR